MNRDGSRDDRLDGDEPFELQHFQLGSDSNFLTSPPSLVYRPGYQRISSLGDVNTEYLRAASPEDHTDGPDDSFSRSGLAITDLGASRIPTTPRVLIDDKSLEDATDILSTTSTRVAGTSSTEFAALFDHSSKVSTTALLPENFQSGSETEHLTSRDVESVGGSYTGSCP